MFERLKAIAALAQDRAEIMALTERDLAELDVTREQLLRLIRMPASVQDRVAAMAAIFDIQDCAHAVPRGTYVEILGNCQSCRARRACAHLLSDATASRADASFCPNAASFAQAQTGT